jgi:hypothetical protein
MIKAGTGLVFWGGFLEEIVSELNLERKQNLATLGGGKKMDEGRLFCA